MSIWLSVILCALLGYLLGCINPAYLIARCDKLPELTF